MELIIHKDRKFLILLSLEERDGMTGRAYIRKRLKEQFGGGIPIDQISIKSHNWKMRHAPAEGWNGYFTVEFNKKSQEYEVLFKMLL